MPYNSNIPLSTDRISSSQEGIQQNFRAISDFIDINHVGFLGGLPGEHTVITLPSVEDVLPTTGDDEMALFSNIGAFTNRTELFVQRPNNDPDLCSISQGRPTTGPRFFGWYRLPNGSLLKWGTRAFDAAAGNYPVTFIGPGARFPEFRTPPWVLIQNNSLVRADISGVTTVNGFTVSKAVGANLDIQYIAIGT